MTKMGILIMILLSFSFFSCREEAAPLNYVEKLDLKEFMGDWYVIAHIPTPIEKNSYNHLEQYELNEKGRIDIRFSLQKYDSDERKMYTARAKIANPEKASVWKVSFFRPIWFPYHLIYLSENEKYCAVGLPNRSYLWIMSRDTFIPEPDYKRIIASVVSQGYDPAEILEVEQNW